MESTQKTIYNRPSSYFVSTQSFTNLWSFKLWYDILILYYINVQGVRAGAFLVQNMSYKNNTLAPRRTAEYR